MEAAACRRRTAWQATNASVPGVPLFVTSVLLLFMVMFASAQRLERHTMKTMRMAPDRPTLLGHRCLQLLFSLGVSQLVCGCFLNKFARQNKCVKVGEQRKKDTQFETSDRKELLLL